MNIEKLTDRERQVFLSIVHGFIQTAEPVGSRYIAKHYQLEISPATIRNVMGDLEDMGLIAQPHTSAGRIPTDQGYRQYVNNMMMVGTLSEEEKVTIIRQLEGFSQDVNSMVQHATDVLSNISSQLGVVLTPRFNKGRLDKIQLVRLSQDKLLMVLNVTSGLVKTVILELNNLQVSGKTLEALEQVLNERLYGLSLAEIQSSIQERFSDLDRDKRQLVRMVLKSGDLNFQDSTTFHFSGAKTILDQPEFENREKIGRILELLDRKDVLIKILDEQNADGVSIVIGEENQEELVKHCSVITTSYSLEEAKGTLGIIGPTRMQYPKIVALVEFMAETLSYLVNKKSTR